MKQKVIVKLSIADEKSRKKAMKIVVGHSGVESASLQGESKNQIEVVGDGIDSVVLTRLLRKSVGYAELVSVNPIPAKKDGENKGGETKNQEVKKNEVIFQPPLFCTNYPYNNGYGYVEVRDTSYDPGCKIM